MNSNGYIPSDPGISTPYEVASFRPITLDTVASTSIVDTFSPFHLIVFAFKNYIWYLVQIKTDTENE